MRQPLTIVMYHYVHKPGRRHFGRLVGRAFEEFQGQLDHIQHRYTVIDAERFFDAVVGGRPLPPNACMLTFDDGYRIHHSVVFKALRERGLRGFFFPPARPVAERIMLDVHKIHFSLACDVGHAEIAGRLRDWIDGSVATFGLEPAAHYWRTYAKPSRFDSAETIFIKRVLQKGLPEDARAAAVDWLFRRYAGRDEAELSAAFYMQTPELTEMVRAGMYVGSHGYAHRWLDTMSEADQSRDVELSLSLLSSIGAPKKDWIMCYPYGGYNQALIDLLQRRGCAAGVTTRIAIADVGTDDLLLLPRLDTNDLPLTAGFEPAEIGRRRPSMAAVG